MRPARLIIVLTFILFTVTLLLLLPKSSRARSVNSAGKPVSGIRSFFSFHSPLFPLSAIISLTDDNSTFFLSRPAAFGPLLPDNGLSGQLWIGRGFGEDPLGRVGVDAVPEGELGCSDVPGWDERLIARLPSPSLHLKTKTTKAGTKDSRHVKDYRGIGDDKELPNELMEDEAELPKTKSDDGTDDYLHQSLVEAANEATGTSGTSDEHADIQSLQETAEIAGKVALLSRGGCGFLEKVKWAQKRGAVAVVVGDNIPGGPLLTMYAKGETDNVTIPALFTSYTTAHLLSSLIPSGGHLGTLPVLNPGGKNGLTSKPLPEGSTESITESFGETESDLAEAKVGWFRSVLECVGLKSTKSKSDNHSSSSEDSWIVAQDWDEDVPRSPGKKGRTANEKQQWSKLEADENFVIGVHDWRNPDVGRRPKQVKNEHEDETTSKRDNSKARKFRGGVAAPESGQYAKPYASKENKAQAKKPAVKSEHGDVGSISSGEQIEKSTTKRVYTQHPPVDTKSSLDQPKAQEAPIHEGLWVTLTPTTLSSSPFIDTLLVLVVSPLVTLTIVYTLLLIRSRIRRRRWRAPKSVVDRLPVRTYHTIPSGASTTSLATPMPGTSNPNTPLLQSTIIARPGARSPRSPSRQRPRSFTTSEVIDQVGQSSLPQQGTPDSAETASLTESEKREKGLAEWRRRYGGRQRECVVCLEEYVDGVSQVMSLPCGHEFHVDCITPWLTTRRRTCPICKGDVVRSLARSERPTSSLRRLGSSNSDNDLEDLDQPLLEQDVEQDIPDDADDPENHGVGRSWTNRDWWQDYWSSWREWFIERRDGDADPDRDR